MLSSQILIFMLDRGSVYLCFVFSSNVQKPGRLSAEPISYWNMSSVFYLLLLLSVPSFLWTQIQSAKEKCYVISFLFLFFRILYVSECLGVIKSGIRILSKSKMNTYSTGLLAQEHEKKNVRVSFRIELFYLIFHLPMFSVYLCDIFRELFCDFMWRMWFLSVNKLFPPYERNRGEIYSEIRYKK